MNRFFGFGGPTKKKATAITSIAPGNLQHQGNISSGRRRGSDRSLSGSAHELAVCGVRDVTSSTRVPHSHSQSNLTDIPYRYAKLNEIIMSIDDHKFHNSFVYF